MDDRPLDDYPDAEAEGLLAGHVVEFSDEAPLRLIEKRGGTPVRPSRLAFKQGLKGA